MEANTLIKSRTAKFDNAKAFLILTVVFGHAITPFLAHSTVKWAHLWLYTFHMPLFIFIGGLFSKRTVNTSPFDFGKVFSYVLLGLFVKITTHFTYLLCGKNPKFNLLEENGVAWYIFALAAHYMIAHALRNFNHRKVLCFSIILALLAGYNESIGNTMVLSRIIVFFPVFYLGYITDKNKLLKLTNKPGVKIISWIILVGVTIALYFIIDEVYTLRYVLTGNNPYCEFGADREPYGPLLRLGCYGISAIMSFCVLSIMPNRRIPLLTYTGENTLQIYALHRQIQFIMDYTFLKEMLNPLDPWYILLIAFLISCLLTLILSPKALKYILYPCTNWQKVFSPVIRWFRK